MLNGLIGSSRNRTLARHAVERSFSAHVNTPCIPVPAFKVNVFCEILSEVKESGPSKGHLHIQSILLELL